MTSTPTTVPEAAQRPLPAADTDRLRMILVVIAAAAAAGCIAAAVLYPQEFYVRYLAAAVFPVSVGAGSLFWLLLHHLTGASWSMVMRRLIEQVTTILVSAAVLFVPLLFGLTYVFSWATDDPDPIIAAKQGYLNQPFFILRALLCFSVWIGLAVVFRRRSLRQDSGNEDTGIRRLRGLSAPGMLLLAVTATFASFDWIMSLDPHWYSNIYGVYFWAGSFSGSLSVITLFALWARRRPGLEEVITVEHLQDLGKLQLGFLSFWAYIAFSQYLLIWYAAIPEETAWFVQRSHDGWGAVGIALACGHFLVPFLVLLPRRSKRSPLVLCCVAIWLLVFHALDLNWQILPAAGSAGHLIHWIDLFAWSLMAAVSLWTVITASIGHALAPLGDPQLRESMAFENE